MRSVRIEGRKCGRPVRVASVLLDLGNLSPGLASVIGVNHIEIPGPLCAGRRETTANRPSLVAARKLYAAKFTGDLAANALALSPNEAERYRTRRVGLGPATRS
jgi:hypothetical protein